MTKITDGFDFSDVSAQDILSGASADVDASDDSGSDNDDTSSSSDDGSDADDQSSDDAAQDGDQDDSQDQGGDQDGAQDGDQGEDGEDDGSQDDGDDAGEGEEGDDDAEQSVIEELQALTGLTLEGEEFSDDLEGVAKFTAKAGEKLGKEYLNNIFEQFPDVQEYFKYRAQGGDSNKYFELSQKANTYQDMSEDTLKGNTDLQKKVVADMYSKMGYTEDDIKDTIKDLEDSELLLKQAVKSGTRLKAIAEEESQAEIQRQAQKAQEQERQQAETWKTIGETITEGNLKGFVVPETDKKSFYDWMSKPVDSKGTTQRQQDMEQMDMESTLALEYLYYKKFDLGNLAKNYKNSAKSNSLRNRLGKKTKSASPAKRLSGGNKGGNSRAVSLPTLNDVF